jgi:hypothetical protein
MIFSKLTFSEWMDREYGDDWPVDDKDLTVWNSYLEYLEKENDE